MSVRARDLLWTDSRWAHFAARVLQKKLMEMGRFQLVPRKRVWPHQLGIVLPSLSKSSITAAMTDLVAAIQQHGIRRFGVLPLPLGCFRALRITDKQSGISLRMIRPYFGEPTTFDVAGGPPRRQRKGTKR